MAELYGVMLDDDGFVIQTWASGSLSLPKGMIQITNKHLWSNLNKTLRFDGIGALRWRVDDKDKPGQFIEQIDTRRKLLVSFSTRNAKIGDPPVELWVTAVTSPENDGIDFECNEKFDIDLNGVIIPAQLERGLFQTSIPTFGQFMLAAQGTREYKLIRGASLTVTKE